MRLRIKMNSRICSEYCYFEFENKMPDKSFIVCIGTGTKMLKIVHTKLKIFKIYIYVRSNKMNMILLKFKLRLYFFKKPLFIILLFYMLSK